MSLQSALNCGSESIVLSFTEHTTKLPQLAVCSYTAVFLDENLLLYSSMTLHSTRIGKLIACKGYDQVVEIEERQLKTIA